MSDNSNPNNNLINPSAILTYVEEFIDPNENNDFPLEVFPSPFYEIIKECNTSLNFPVDYMALAVLSAVSTAIGKSAKLNVKKGWFEFAALYAAIIGNAGTNKSHPINIAFAPLEEIDLKKIKKFEIEYNAYAEYQSLSKKEKQQTERIEMPILSKSILHNFTPEILHQRLFDNTRGCAVVSEELATFLEGMNNYSKGDQTSIYLSFWSNKGTSIDRVSKPIPLWIAQPFLNIFGSLQPRVLSKLFPTSKSDNGFLQRFLFAFVASAFKQPINDFEISDDAIINYTNWINDYITNNPIDATNELNQTQSKIYYWSTEAKEFFYKWQAENTNQVNENADTLKAEIISKFDIHFVRLALILQIMDDYFTNLISLKAVQGASKLCKYFYNCSLLVLDILEKPNAPDILPQDKQNLFNDLSQEFTTAQAIELGKKYKIEARSVKTFIAKSDIFKKISHGNYSKI